MANGDKLLLRKSITENMYSALKNEIKHRDTLESCLLGTSLRARLIGVDRNDLSKVFVQLTVEFLSKQCMLRSKSLDLQVFDPEIERTARRLRKARRKHMEENREEPPAAVPIRDHFRPVINAHYSGIARGTIAANNFELKPALINTVQQNQFGGGATSDPHLYLRTFLEIAYTLCDVPKEPIPWKKMMKRGTSTDALAKKFEAYDFSGAIYAGNKEKEVLVRDIWVFEKSLFHQGAYWRLCGRIKL